MSATAGPPNGLQLQSLIRSLSFACKIILPGHQFLQCFINYLTSNHSAIPLDDEFQANIQWWLTFLPYWNSALVFHSVDWTATPDAPVWTDASGDIGLGAYFEGE